MIIKMKKFNRKAEFLDCLVGIRLQKIKKLSSEREKNEENQKISPKGPTSALPGPQKEKKQNMG